MTLPRFALALAAAAAFLTGGPRPEHFEQRGEVSGHHRAGARRADGPRARGRGARQAGLGGPADHPQAGMAHLLEELRRLGPAHRAGMDAARRRHRRRHCLAHAQKNPHWHAGQLWLRRHRAAAGAADRSAPNFKPGLLSGELDIKLKAAWLVCKKECIPEEGEFTLKLPVKSTTAINGAAFDAAFKAQPRPLMGNTGIVPDSQVQIDGNAIRLTVQNLPVSLRGKTLDVFPETPEVIETAATPTRAGKARSGRPACRCRPSAATARRSCRLCWPRVPRRTGPS
jgi:hypothetical protein